MRQALTLHPDSRCDAVTGIEVEAARPRPAALAVRYFATGAIAGLRLPPVTAPARTDELWRHTCFEVFVRAPPRDAYYEFNFAPSRQWAGYRFSGYRRGVSIAAAITTPRIDVQSNAEHYELEVSLALGPLPDLPDDVSWLLGLSAVIEELGGRKSYWALAHPPGKPDFHHMDCFALELPRAWPP